MHLTVSSMKIEKTNETGHEAESDKRDEMKIKDVERNG